MDMEKNRLASLHMSPGVQPSAQPSLQRGKQFLVIHHDGSSGLFDVNRIYKTIRWASIGHERFIDADAIVQETIRNIYDGISAAEISDALILGTVPFIEKEPAYGYVAAQLVLKKLFREVTGVSIEFCDREQLYRRSFISSIQRGVAVGLLDERLLNFDLERLSHELVLQRDRELYFMGMKTLYERYFAKIENKRSELPQSFWMRVAMGLALLEEKCTDRAIEFYHLISTMRYVPGTPTLLHAGLTKPQLSSCYLTTVVDDLHHIYKCIGDNAQMSKWSGGVANDWTNIRATGAMINSIRVESQGVVPFLKVVNDTTAAINRSGKRRSALVVYLETWHYDIEDFLDLRRNTGDERRRAHDINTANWVPDLFMQRVKDDGMWTLFSPDETPDLHALYGKAFKQRYEEYEALAEQGKIRLFKRMPAVQLWRKMLSRIFETGHPWITFKDAFNVRSPQDHAGVINSTNLCTEISLNTSADETAVCNLGSINLARHVVDGKIDDAALQETIKGAIRMLDNVIDINYYPTIEGKNANMRHRPVGLGVMGWQDMLYMCDVAMDDPRARDLADETLEKVAYNAIMASSQLAAERGAYSSFVGSKWDRGYLPQDTIDLLQEQREVPIKTPRNGKLNWEPVRASIRAHGMRNSNTMAIAPTATISNIANCYPCIEPIYKNLYVKSNMSGEFTVVNHYLIADLKALGLWNEHMLDQLKYYDGNIQRVPEIPDNLKAKYKEAFELDPEWLLEITASFGKWIDQSISHNIFMQGASGKKLSDTYMKAWQWGLKATYYCRTLGATQIEKSTLNAQEYGFTQKRNQVEVAEKKEATQTTNEQRDKAVMCSILNGPDCDSCQ
jgi:ribonucleoside-diphosphate reductase alpha chain